MPNVRIQRDGEQLSFWPVSFALLRVQFKDEAVEGLFTDLRKKRRLVRKVAVESRRERTRAFPRWPAK